VSTFFARTSIRVSEYSLTLWALPVIAMQPFPLVLAGNRTAEYLPIALSRSGKGGCAQIASFGVTAGRLLGDGISLI
jgi:hypothetical protein